MLNTKVIHQELTITLILLQTDNQTIKQASKQTNKKKKKYQIKNLNILINKKAKFILIYNILK